MAARGQKRVGEFAEFVGACASSHPAGISRENHPDAIGAGFYFATEPLDHVDKAHIALQHSALVAGVEPAQEHGAVERDRQRQGRNEIAGGAGVRLESAG